MKDITYTGDTRDVFEYTPTVTSAITVRGGYSSPEAFVRWLADQKPWCKEGRHTLGGDEGFYGNVTYSQACDMIIDGWQEGARKAEALRDKINANNPIGPRLVKYSVAGAVPNVSRMLAGNPLNMRQIDQAKLRRRPVLTLVAHFGATGEVEADAMLRRSAVVASIIDAVEAGGYSCHVIAYTVSRGQSDVTVATAVTLKDAGSHVDVSRMAFGLGHPAMLRRLTFAWRSSVKEAQPIGTGMGGTITGDLKMPEGSYLIPAIQSTGVDKFATDEKAGTQGLQAIIADLKRQGCPAFCGEA